MNTTAINTQPFFNYLNNNEHYSTAFIKYLLQTIDKTHSNFHQYTDMTTFQQINSLIDRHCSCLIKYFHENTHKMKSCENKNPLCFESIKQFYQRLTRSVYKKYGSDLLKFKQGLKFISEDLIQVISSSTTKVITNAEIFYQEPGTKKIMTYGYSKSVCSTLRRMNKNIGQHLTVYVCRGGGLQEGARTYKQLSLENINCYFIDDCQIGYYISQIDYVMVGAEVVLQNGGILNRAGTYMLALVAYENHKSFYVLAESYKFIRKVYLCQKDIPQQYQLSLVQHEQQHISIDLTPPKYITMFCMDHGVFTPDTVSVQLGKMFQSL